MPLVAVLKVVVGAAAGYVLAPTTTKFFRWDWRNIQREAEEKQWMR